MSAETALRVAAVLLATAVLAAPYYETISAKAIVLAELAKKHAGGISRLVAACLIVAAAWGKVPMPSFTVDLHRPSAVVVEPSEAMKALVAPVRDALAAAPPHARSAWVEVWSKAAQVVESESAARDQIFKDVSSLRVLTVTALDIGWRRLSGVAPGSLAGLRAGVEAALASAVGTEARPLTDEMRASYVEVSRALAWAGAR